MPPTPASPRDSSELGAPGDVVTGVPAGTGRDSPAFTVTVDAVTSKATMVRVWTSPPVPNVIALPTSRFAVEASRIWVAPSSAASATVVDAGRRRNCRASPVTRVSVGDPVTAVMSR